MKIVVTGGEGFIGMNLRVRLRELGHGNVVSIGRKSSAQELAAALAAADMVYHLAGVNRPKDVAEFASGNAGTTETLCEALEAQGRRVPIAYASSTQAALDNPYGASKLAAEERLLRYQATTGAPVYVFRLTNVFGKWSRPNYNSVVATFCHNIARGLPITVSDPAAPLRLVYVDDVVERFASLLGCSERIGPMEAGPVHETTVGALAHTLQAFKASRDTLTTEPVGTGLTRALWSTYVSFLPVESFAYDVPRHADPRGVFVEMLKTPDCGQFSYFTAHPGVTRGEHYHHSKTEKFLVIKGTAHFSFRHIVTGETHELVTQGGDGRIVETVPGWTHNITNVGSGELIVMLWANEIFDRDRPDTVSMKVKP